MKAIVLSTAYLPPLSYVYHLLSGAPLFIEQYEHYTKQSYRNRCEILSANGPLALSIPLVKQAPKELLKDKRISYAEKWQQQHWRAITSAYKNSPFFEFFEEEFRYFYENQFELLLDYNTQLLRTIFKILRQPLDLQLTQEYLPTNDTFIDLRESIHPKHKQASARPAYYQVFGERFGFVEDLSIVDLLFNKGLESSVYLRNC